MEKTSLVPIHKWLFSPISLLGGKFNRRHMVDIPRIKFFAQRRYRANWPFMDGHYLKSWTMKGRLIQGAISWEQAFLVEKIFPPP
jgi:hypothetical protein